jgi:hypothetical protein
MDTFDEHEFERDVAADLTLDEDLLQAVQQMGTPLIDFFTVNLLTQKSLERGLMEFDRFNLIRKHLKVYADLPALYNTLKRITKKVPDEFRNQFGDCIAKIYPKRNRKDAVLVSLCFEFLYDAYSSFAFSTEIDWKTRISEIWDRIKYLRSRNIAAMLGQPEQERKICLCES